MNIGGEVPDSKERDGLGLGVKVWLAMIAIPATVFVGGLLVSFLIPGCNCDSGAGCSGCGPNDFVAFCLFGGFIGALGAAMFGWPVMLLFKLFE